MHTVIMFESGHFQRETTNIPLYKFDIYPHAKENESTVHNCLFHSCKLCNDFKGHILNVY